MKKILLILCLFPIFVFSQKSYKIPADSTILNNIGSGKNELVIRNATSNITGGVLTNLGNGVTAFVLGGGSARVVDTIYKNNTKDSIVFTISGIRYAVKDSIGVTDLSGYALQSSLNDTASTLRRIRKVDSSYLFKNATRDSICMVTVINGNTYRTCAFDSSNVNTDSQSLQLFFTDSILLGITRGNSIKFAYAVDSVGLNAGGDSIVVIKAGLRLAYKIGGGGGGSGWALTGNASTDSSANFLGTTDLKPLLIRTNNNTVVKIDKEGKIGVGNTAPISTLHVSGGQYLSLSNVFTLAPKLSNLKFNTSFDMVDSSIYVGLNSYFTQASSWLAAQAVASYIKASSAGLTLSVSSGNTINGAYTNSATTKAIHLFANGNVTVGGITDWGYRLNSNCSTNGFDGMLIQNSSSGGSNKGGIMFYNGNGNLTSLIYKAGSSFTTVANRNTLFVESGEANGIAVSATNASGYIKFLQNSTESMRVHSNGNVGIGTVAPSANAKLEITTTTSAPIKLTPMTAAQASALTAEDGQIVYVSTTDATFVSIGFWGRENGVWVKL